MKTHYWAEKNKNGRYYVYYWNDPVKILFDVVSTKLDAKKSIAQHKKGTHPTQWKPSKIK